MDLHERICKYLSRVEPAVSQQQGHNRTFATACALYNGFALDESQLYSYMELYNGRCQPPWDEKDLRRKCSEAVRAQHTKPRGHLIGGNGTFSADDFNYKSFPAAVKAEPKPTIDPVTAIEKFLVGHSCEEADLWEASPIKPSEDWTKDGPLLVGALFQNGEFVNFVTEYSIAKNKEGVEKCIPGGKGVTLPRMEICEDWMTFGTPTSDAGGWMRINPMQEVGIADKDVTAFRHLLLEFDTIPLELQLSFFSKLPLPIAAILTSGGKSVHAWVKVDCRDLTEYKDTATMIFKYLSRFGVDLQNKNPSRLSRLVGAQRKLGAHGDGRQRILYLNPNPTQKAIL
jgi:hypothetical protein